MGISKLWAPLSRLRERGWGRGHGFHELPDSFKHAFHPVQHIVIPEAQHRETPRHQPRITFVIIGDLIAMLTAADFDHQCTFRANEIGDIRAERMDLA